MICSRRALLPALLIGALAIVALADQARARPSAEPSLARVSQHLRDARTRARQRMAVAENAAADSVLRWRDGRLEIELRFDALEPPTVAALGALGAQVEHVSYRYRRVLVLAEPELLPALAALPGIATVQPNYGAQRNSGVVPGQGDASIHADMARARFAVDGSGVRVGVLSDSFALRNRGTITGSGCDRQVAGSAAQVNGDLPPQVVTLDDGPMGSADEGAAMAEIVHDVAPGAALLFASAYSDEATFAENIDALAACGVDVLTDDVIYFAEPMFQDGIIAQAAQAAVDSGIAFFSAAGNQGRAGIEAVYRDSNPAVEDDAPQPTGDDFHDFGGGNRFAAVTVPRGCGVRVVLQWDEPFSGALGAGASTDLDLYVFRTDSPSADIVADGTDSQGCSVRDGATGGDPLEIALYSNTTITPQTVYLAVDHFCGRADVRFRVVTFPTCVLSTDYVFPPDVFDAGQIYGHMAVPGVAAMAAVFFGEIDTAGALRGPTAGIDVEPFSPRGGAVPIALDATGMRLPGGPVRRNKPDLTGPDGVNTNFFGVDSPYDVDHFPNFLGTSAAAPHAAGVAALLLQAHPGLPPVALMDVLRTTAVDIEAPGYDPIAGYGLIDALSALELPLAATATPTASPTPTPTATVATSRPGDCDGDGMVTIDELIVAVRLALGETTPACGAADSNGDGRVGIDDLIRAVSAAL